MDRRWQRRRDAPAISVDSCNSVNRCNDHTFLAKVARVKKFGSNDDTANLIKSNKSFCNWSELHVFM